DPVCAERAGELDGRCRLRRRSALVQMDPAGEERDARPPDGARDDLSLVTRGFARTEPLDLLVAHAARPLEDLEDRTEPGPHDPGHAHRTTEPAEEAGGGALDPLAFVGLHAPAFPLPGLAPNQNSLRMARRTSWSPRTGLMSLLKAY